MLSTPQYDCNGRVTNVKYLAGPCPDHEDPRHDGASYADLNYGPSFEEMSRMSPLKEGQRIIYDYASPFDDPAALKDQHRSYDHTSPVREAVPVADQPRANTDRRYRRSRSPPVPKQRREKITDGWEGYSNLISMNEKRRVKLADMKEKDGRGNKEGIVWMRNHRLKEKEKSARYSTKLRDQAQSRPRP
ncbi:hypothetical protein MMC09_000582 [Bachmanniomyces sp. S44760]|nr:hypothetical protein [Bachmanniomyces sp. S44760]